MKIKIIKKKKKNKSKSKVKAKIQCITASSYMISNRNYGMK